MKRTSVSILAILILVGGSGAALRAAEEPPSDLGLEREVRRLNATLAELVELLRLQVEGSNATMLMQRVQLMTSRIAPLEAELRGARDERQDLQRELDELEIAAERFESQMARAIEVEEMTAEEVRTLEEQERPIFDQRRKQLRERLWTAQQLVIDLEQRLAERRAELETWEGEIDRVLGLR